MIQPLDTLFLVLLIITAVSALEADDLLSAVIIFGAFSFFSATFYAIVGALDVAFTEVALGAVIATVFFVSAVHRSHRKPKPLPRASGTAGLPAPPHRNRPRGDKDPA